jgi:hypothetical protein
MSDVMNTRDKKSSRLNPVFWLMFLLPGLAVAGGLVTVAIAFTHADRKLPPQYHWEGDHLDADFARASRAAEQGLAGTLEVHAAQKLCVVNLPAAGAESLLLLLTHSDDAGLDRQLRLQRVRPGVYQTECEAPPAAKWRISLGDDANTWAIRARAEGLLTQVPLRARNPAGSGP